MADYGIDVVRRAFRALEILATAESMSLAEISAQLGVGKATAYRLMATLCMDDVAIQHPETKKYRLGPRLIALGHRAADTTDVIDAATDAMSRLAAEYQVVITVNLATTQGVLEARRIPKHGRGEFVPIGAPIPYHACASGLVFLAYDAGSLRQTVLGGGLVRLASGTPVTAEDVDASLVTIRATGSVLVRDTLSEGITAVAAPVADRTGAVTATLGATAPSGALNAEAWEQLMVDLREAAHGVSVRLGGTGAPVVDAGHPSA